MDNFVDALDQIIEQNETFIGKELDEKKAKRLNKLRTLCRFVAENVRGAELVDFAFTERCQHGLVLIDFPEVKTITNGKILDAMTGLFAETDDFTVAITDEGNIRFSFAIHNMWKSFGRTTDDDQDPDKWHGKLKVVK